MPRKANVRPTTIYWLIDMRPETIASGWPIGKPFYCGKTVTNIERRISNHFMTARKWPKRKLSLVITDVGPAISARTVEVVPVDADWATRERSWIRALRYLNPECANTADGGEGAAGYVPTPEHRAKLSVANSGHKHSAESLAKMRRPRRPKVWVFSPEHRSKLSVANKTSQRAAEARIKLASSLKGRKFSDEHRANLSAARKKSSKAMAAAFANLQAIKLKRALKQEERA